VNTPTLYSVKLHYFIKDKIKTIVDFVLEPAVAPPPPPGHVNYVLSLKFKQYAARIRAEKDLAKVPAIKLQALKEIYKILAMNFGMPPKTFQWRYETKEKKLTDIKTYRYLINLPEGSLFWSSVILILVSVVLFLAIVIYWMLQGFRFIAIEKETLVIVTFASNGMLLVFDVVTAHLLKRF
jgi:uncharacterized membrane protein YwzB